MQGRTFQAKMVEVDRLKPLRLFVPLGTMRSLRPHRISSWSTREVLPPHKDKPFPNEHQAKQATRGWPVTLGVLLRQPSFERLVQQPLRKRLGICGQIGGAAFGANGFRSMEPKSPFEATSES